MVEEINKKEITKTTQTFHFYKRSGFVSPNLQLWNNFLYCPEPSVVSMVTREAAVARWKKLKRNHVRLYKQRLHSYSLLLPLTSVMCHQGLQWQSPLGPESLPFTLHLNNFRFLRFVQLLLPQWKLQLSVGACDACDFWFLAHLKPTGAGLWSAPPWHGPPTAAACCC